MSRYVEHLNQIYCYSNPLIFYTRQPLIGWIYVIILFSQSDETNEINDYQS